MKKILCITNKELISSDMPGNPRLYEICNSLKDEFEIHIVIIDHKNKNPRIDSDLYRIFKSVIVLPLLLQKEKSVDKFLRYLFAIPSEFPNIIRRKKITNIKKHIDLINELINPDFVYVDGLTPSSFLTSQLLARSTVDLCDSVSKLKFREALKSELFTRKCAFLFEAFSIYIREWFCVCKAKNISFISEDEISFYPLVFRKNIHIVPQGVCVESFPFQTYSHTLKDIIFFGALDYAPNEDAAFFFIHEIYPHIKDFIKERKIIIAGKSPSEKIRSLSSSQVLILPDVPSMIYNIHAAGIVVVPLRFGAGVKNKILVSGLAGRPLIVSSIALEGLPDEVRSFLFVADSAEEYISQIHKIESYSERELNTHLKNFHDYILKVYSWNNSAHAVKKMFNTTN